MRRPWTSLQFALERFIVRGPFHRLLVVAALIAGIAVIAGAVVFGAGVISNFPQAVWWGFLRLTDPGYLGDDEGTLKRVVSTIVTVLGYVVFLGALVAIMTQWFQQTMARIQGGTTPVSMRDHFVIFGWTNRTAAIVRELVTSENRVRRFYEKRGAHDDLRIVILADDDVNHVREELRQDLGPRYSPDHIIVRVGSPLRPEHLDRVDFAHAAAVLVPADPSSVQVVSNIDATTIKALLSTTVSARELLGVDEPLPLIVAELSDSRKVALARSAYPGALETLATDRIIARIIAQNIRHRGLSRVTGELLSHAVGSEIYVRDWRKPAVPFRSVAGSYVNALPIGIVRGTPGSYATVLNPGLDEPVATDDKVILLAADYAATTAGNDDGTFAKVEAQFENVALELPSRRRVLILGWNRKIPVLLEELEGYEREQFEVHNVSLKEAEERMLAVRRQVGELKRVNLTLVEGELTSENDLHDVNLESFDDVVIASSDWLEEDAMSDARSILGYLVVRELLEDAPKRPHLIVELLDPDNEPLLEGRDGDVIVTPTMVSHMLTHIALRRELGAVFEELFGPHGAEIFFVPPDRYQLGDGPVRFDAIRRAVAARGSVALGVVLKGEVLINPDSSAQFDLPEVTDVVVLSTY